jgi:WbqC-like protein
MRVAISQSNYLPWKGYFDLIHDVDLFVFYDDVQFTKNDWRNRNRIKGPNGPEWLTIPVGTDLKRRVCDVALTDARWQARHWNTLRHRYGKAPGFARYRAFLEDVYVNRQWKNLSELNRFLIRTIAADWLGVTTRFGDSREFPSEGVKQDRVLNLLHAVGADVYVSGPAGRAYLDGQRFERAGIRLEWKDYTGYPEYAQFHAGFEHRVSILDLLFHVGCAAPYFIWGWRQTGGAGSR